MYMAPVVHVRPAPSPAARRRAGTAALLIAALVMAPWLAINAAVSGAVLGALACRRGHRAVLGAIDYAGEVVLGR